MNNLLPYDGEMYFFSNYLKKPDQLYEELMELVEWKSETIKIFGKEVLQPRLTAYFGDSFGHYTYSGRTMLPLPWLSSLRGLKQRLANDFHYDFTNVLLNYYRDGSDSMGWHRDNEKELGMNPILASLSLGTTRLFKMRHRKTKEVLSMELTSGSLLIMGGTAQEYWEHSVPKSKKVVTPRLNLTFRRIISH